MISRKRLRALHKQKLLDKHAEELRVKALRKELRDPMTLQGRRDEIKLELGIAKLKVCKHCGKEHMPYRNKYQGICDVCLGRAVPAFGGFIYPAFVRGKPLEFTLWPSGVRYTSVSSAARALELNNTSLWRLVTGAVDEYQGLTSELHSKPLSIDDLQNHKPQYY